MKKLQSLIDNNTIKSFVFNEQVPTMEGDNESRLADELVLLFTNGETLKISTFCSGSLENTSIIIE